MRRDAVTVTVTATGGRVAATHPLRARVHRGLAPSLATLGLLVSACIAEPVDDLGDELDSIPPVSERDGAFPLQNPIPGFQVPAPLAAAHCEINVEGQGLLDLEQDYLPHVIQCENGGANLEALKAQAIAARSVAYYAIETSGSICDSQGCQVYSCGSTPTALQHQAVDETSGVYLMYNNTLTYGFYVSGDSATSPPSCVGNPGVSIEQWVTYNDGLSGTDVEQTALGFIHSPGDAGYGQNRGCMAQWGARCLENDLGYDYESILQFYYGADIQTIQANGACVLPLPGQGGDSSGGPGDTGTPGDTTSGMADTGPIGPGDTTWGGDPTGLDTAGDDSPFPGGTAGATSGVPADTGGMSLDSGPALPTTFGEDTDGGGCSCRARGPSGSAAGWLALLGLLGLRRRRR